MTDDVDRRIAALLAEPPFPADPAFVDRVVALAAYDLAIARSQQRQLVEIGREALALAVVLVSFAMLARLVPDGVGLGDVVPLGSPAMIGLALLALWGVSAARPATA